MKWFFWKKQERGGKSAHRTPETPCPKCGGETVLLEKHTMTGRDLRTHRCARCQEDHVVDRGIAMWKLMSDANKVDPEE